MRAGKSGLVMRAYELRLLDARGGTVAIYAVNCKDDAAARAAILNVGDADYERYEVWNGMERIAHGGRIIMANAPEASRLSLKDSLVLTQ